MFNVGGAPSGTLYYYSHEVVVCHGRVAHSSHDASLRVSNSDPHLVTWQNGKCSILLCAQRPRLFKFFVCFKSDPHLMGSASYARGISDPPFHVTVAQHPTSFARDWAQRIA